MATRGVIQPTVEMPPLGPSSRCFPQQRERESDRDRDRERETETERHRERDRERERKRQRETETERQRQRERVLSFTNKTECLQKQHMTTTAGKSMKNDNSITD